MLLNMHIYPNTHIYVCIYIYMYVYIYMYIYVYNMYLYIYIHTYTHLYMDDIPTCGWLNLNPIYIIIYPHLLVRESSHALNPLIHRSMEVPSPGQFSHWTSKPEAPYVWCVSSTKVDVRCKQLLKYLSQFERIVETIANNFHNCRHNCKQLLKQLQAIIHNI